MDIINPSSGGAQLLSIPPAQIQIQSLGGGAVIGAYTTNRIQGIREGRFCTLFFDLEQSGAGTAGAAGDYYLTLPIGLVADSAFVIANTSPNAGQKTTPAGMVQSSFSISGSTTIRSDNATATFRTMTAFRLHYRTTAGAPEAFNAAGLYKLSDAALKISGWIRFPVQGWT